MNASSRRMTKMIMYFNAIYFSLDHGETLSQKTYTSLNQLSFNNEYEQLDLIL